MLEVKYVNISCLSVGAGPDLTLDNVSVVAGGGNTGAEQKRMFGSNNISNGVCREIFQSNARVTQLKRLMPFKWGRNIHFILS